MRSQRGRWARAKAHKHRALTRCANSAGPGRRQQGNQEIQALRAREVSVACVCVCATSSLLCASPVPSLSALTGRRKTRCVDCGGKSLCQHKRQKHQCKVRACCRRPCTPSVCACVCVCLRVRACVCTKIPHNRRNAEGRPFASTIGERSVRLLVRNVLASFRVVCSVAERRDWQAQGQVRRLRRKGPLPAQAPEAAV